MAAFVVVAPPARNSVPRTGVRLGIFPGSATPAVFPANAPFWIGYGFVPEPTDAEQRALDAETRFELEVDGQPVSLATDVRVDCGHVVSKQCIANFAAGLPAGWHRFAGRWYDGGALVLTSDTSVQFVER